MIALITDKGTIELDHGSGGCMGCNRHGGGMVELTIHHVEQDHPVKALLCGNCVGQALGGVIKAKIDRRQAPHEFDPPNIEPDEKAVLR